MPKIKLISVRKGYSRRDRDDVRGNATTALALILGRRSTLTCPARCGQQRQDPSMLKMSAEEPVIGIHMQIFSQRRATRS
jgi:hypothetical protein